MTKQEYLKQLTEKLGVFDEALAKEIIDDYEGHFREGNDNGKTEEEICEELGSVDEIIEELCQLYEPKKKEEYNYKSTVNEVVNDALHLANSVADSIVKGIKSGIDYGKKTWYEKTKEDVVDVECVKEEICNCRKAVIDASCADVTIAMSEDDDFHLEYINRGSLKDRILYHFKGEQRGDVFYGHLIREQGNSSLFQMLKTPEIELVMKIPQNFERVETEASSGDICLNNIKIKELYITTASGDIVSNNSEVIKGALESASGDITIRETKGNTLKLKAKSGEIVVNNCVFEDIVCKSKSGDINSEGSSITRLSAEISSGNANFGRLTADSLSINEKSGNISLTECKLKDLSAAADSGSIIITSTDSEKIDAGSESGDIKIRSAAEYYSLKTSSGDIELQAGAGFDGNIKSVSGNVQINILDGEGGYTAEVSTVSGNITLQYSNESKHGMHKGVYVMGEGKSALTVSNVSGDILIHA